MRALDPSHLILGEHQATAAGVGFLRPQAGPPEELIDYNGDKHLLTVAPTRSGKGRDVIIPNLLHYEGPVVCIDPKGENIAVVERRRRDMGHRVITLDPFGVTGKQTDALNSLDIFSLQGTDPESDSQMLAELLSRGITGSKEPFWDISATGLLSGLICHAATQGDPAEANLLNVIDNLFNDDVTYHLAVLLDTRKDMKRFACREIASLLQLSDITRSGVLASAQAYLKVFHTESMRRVLQKSTFSLQSIVDGEPVDVFIVIPPNRLMSHKALLKLQVGTLLAAVLSRQNRPPLRTLFVLDELAQLETFPLLETMVTLAGGYGVWVWMFLQDLGQLQHCYPTSWKPILNNCGVVQTFGINNRGMAELWSSYLEHGPHALQSLKRDEQVLRVQGAGEIRCKRVNYLCDERFAGRYDRNPLYSNPQRDGR